MQGSLTNMFSRARGAWCVFLLLLISLGLFAQTSPEATLDRSRALAQAGHLEDAQILLDGVAETIPDNLRDDFLYTRGLVLTQQGRWQAARDDFTQLTKRAPNFYPGHYMAGFAALNGGKGKVALAHFKAAAKLDPERLAPKLQQALCLDLLGEKDLSFKALTLLVKQHPEFVSGREALARNYFNSRNLARAISLLKSTPLDSPLTASGHALFGQILLQDGDHAGAFEHLQEARLAGFGTGASLHNLSLLAYQQDDLPLATTSNTEARQLGPKDSEVLLHQGLIELSHGRDLQAETIWAKLVKTPEAPWQARFNLALLRAKSGRYQQSLSALGPVRRGSREAFPIRLLRAGLDLAKGDYAHAGPVFEELIQEQPESLPARINMAFLYLAAGEWDLAQPHVEYALVQPEALPTVIALADFMLAAQQAELASSIYQMALVESPDDPELVIKTATAFLDAGNEDQAQKLFQDYDTLVSTQSEGTRGK